MMYRMLAINIDGTLLQTNGRIHKLTKEAIDYVQEKGVYVTLVTSRTFLSAKKIAKALRLDTNLITHRGAYISKEIDKPVRASRIQGNITYDIVRLLEGFPCQIRLVHEHFSIANKYKLKHRFLTKTAFTTRDPIVYSQQFVDSIGDTIAEEPAMPLSIEVYFEYKEDLKDVQEALRKMYPEIDPVSLNEYRMDIVLQGASKLNGILYIAENLGIPRSQIVCIGDDVEDIEMIQAVGLGVAMGNAPFEVKRAADWITRSQNQQGVAFMVKEHFRKQQRIEFLRKLNIKK